MDALGNASIALVAVGKVSVVDGVGTVTERQGKWTLTKSDVGRWLVTMQEARHFIVSAMPEGPPGSGGYPATSIGVADVNPTSFEIDMFDLTGTAEATRGGLINADGTAAISHGAFTPGAHTPASGQYSITGLTGIDLTTVDVLNVSAAGHSEGGGTGGGVINFNVLSATSFGAIITNQAGDPLDTAWSFTIQGQSQGGAAVPVDLSFSFRVYEIISSN